jgi:hypothetical protein
MASHSRRQQCTKHEVANTRECDKFLVNKTNRCTEFQIYWYYDSTCISGSLSAHHQEFLAVNRRWYILCSCDERLLPGVGWNCAAVPSYSWWQNNWNNSNKIGILCICWFYSQGIRYDARSYDRKIQGDKYLYFSFPYN